MFFHTMQFKTPAALHGRLREVEKIDLRRATHGRVEYLFNSHYKNEVETLEKLLEVKALCDKDMADYDAITDLGTTGGYIPSTWKF